MALRAKEYRAKNPEAHAAAVARHHKNHPEKRLEYKRKWMLMSQYGLTVEQFNTLREAQESKCAGCKVHIEGKNLHVDHCHETGIVRGLLCSNCNTGLGMFKDDPSLLMQMAQYLAYPPATTILQMEVR